MSESLTLDFAKMKGLIPAVIQDADSGQVLMLGYMNEDALNKTRETERVTFFSRSRQTLWTKGETSGHYLKLVSIAADCDNDALLICARPVGPTCHLGTQSCFGESTAHALGFLSELEAVVKDRQGADPASSYTASLFEKGTKRIAQKVGEEGVETALAAMAADPEEIQSEAADLLYHLTVLLADAQLSLADVANLLRSRHQN